MARATPSPPRALSADLIVGTALRIADAEGLEALSMRRVGSELGCAAMSLYGHVASKDELLERLADHVLGLVGDIDARAPWEDAVVAFFAELHDVLLEHPPAAAIATQRPTTGPNAMRQGGQVLAVLRAAGLGEDLATECFTALSCHALGAALYNSARPQARARAHEQVRSGLAHLVRGYAADLPG